MIQTVVFDTKPYDRRTTPARLRGELEIEWRFMDCRLSAETADGRARALGQSASS